jgi:hypothetical protein
MRRSVRIGVFGFLVSVLGMAAPLDLGTFAVSGSGSFACDQTDFVSGGLINFSGSNSNYSISVGGNISNASSRNGFLPACGVTLGQDLVIGIDQPQLGPVDVASFSYQDLNAAPGDFNVTQYGTFQLGDGTGFVNFYSCPFSIGPCFLANQLTLVATAKLSGIVTVDSVTTTAPVFPSWQGTLAITSGGPTGGTQTPEPSGALALVVSSGFALLLRRKGLSSNA